MKKKTLIITYCIVCALIIAGAIYAGEKYHDNCTVCKPPIKSTAIKQ